MLSTSTPSTSAQPPPPPTDRQQQFVRSYFQPAAPQPPQQPQNPARPWSQLEQPSMFASSASATPSGLVHQGQQLGVGRRPPAVKSGGGGETINSIYDVFANTSTSTAYHHSAADYTPMEMSPVRRGGGGGGGSEDVFNNSTIGTTPSTPNLVTTTPGSLRRHQQPLDTRYPHMVTVFGFAPEASASVLSHFSNFGTIRSYQFVGNSNWMNVEYDTDMQAQTALSKNGMIIGDTMIGVVPMRQRHESSASTGNPISSALASPLKVHDTSTWASSTKANMMPTVTPVKQQQQQRPPLASAYPPGQKGYLASSNSSNGRQNGTTAETTTGHQASMFGVVMERIFGW